LGLALCAATGYNSFLYLGLRSTSIVNAALINATTPAVVGILSAVLLKNNLTRMQFFGALLSILGVLQIAVRGEWVSLAQLGFKYSRCLYFYWCGAVWLVYAVVAFCA
jgi:drug/metabolite transporter (DMT)-like permease